MTAQQAGQPGGGHAARRAPMAWLRNASIRRKLAMIIVIPLATVLTLATLRISSNIREASSATALRDLTTLSRAAAALSDDLSHERITAAQVVLTGDARSALADRRRTTDRATHRFQQLVAGLGDVPADVGADLREVHNFLATLPALRQQVTRRQTVGSAVALRYEVVISALNTYRNSVAQHAGNSEEGNPIRASALFSEVKADVGYEQTLGYVGLRSGQFGPDERATFAAALHAQEQSLLRFMRTATVSQRKLVSTTVSGDAVHLADTLITGLSRETGSGSTGQADEVRRALGSMADLMRWVEEQLDAGVARQVSGYHDQVIRQVTGETLGVLLAIGLAVLVTLMLARVMSRSLRRLGAAADTIARRDLPRAVARLQAPGRARPSSLPALVADAYDPIRVVGDDEIGRLARSFNGVHREALRIALEQAMLRINVSAMFVSLARRSQKLVDQMIARLDQIEREEQHPQRLAQLFELDHLATQMRRNDENLLILAGSDAASPRSEDAALSDVLAAAQSEIARYERIEIGPLNIDGEPDELVAIGAAAVNDVVRLFAELLENAATFSPPSRRVRVCARRLSDRVLVEIEDHGIGMKQDRLDELNRRLAEPEDSTVASVRMMGFAVVHRLADRHRIRVHLGSVATGGTVVHVTLPAQLVSVSRAAPTPARRTPVVPHHAARDRTAPLAAGSPGHTSTPGRAATSGRTAAPGRTATSGHATTPGRTGTAGPAEWFSSSTARVAGPTSPQTTVDDRRRPSPESRPRSAEERAAGRPALPVRHTPSDRTRTHRGMPVRDPMSQLAPGLSGPQPVAEDIPRHAGAVRSFLTEYQRGVSTGRDRRASAGRDARSAAAHQSSHPNRTGESASQ